MSLISGNEPPKSSWKDAGGLTTVSLHALWAQVHARAKRARLPGEFAETSDRDVCGRRHSAPDCPASAGLATDGAYGVTDVAEALPKAPLSNEVNEGDLDEMFTFIGDKKAKSTLSLW